jgi:hypothetical protein
VGINFTMSSNCSSSGPGVTRETVKLLSQYEADEGPLTAAQLRQIKKAVPQNTQRSVRSSLRERSPTRSDSIARYATPFAGAGSACGVSGGEWGDMVGSVL